MRSVFLFTSVVLASCITGCGGVSVVANPAPVPVSGSVVQAGKPVSDVVLNFQPTGPGALPCTVTLKEGKFEAHVSPGKYTWYLSEASKDIRNAKQAFGAIPTSFQEGSLERQIDIEPGKEMELIVN